MYAIFLRFFFHWNYGFIYTDLCLSAAIAVMQEYRGGVGLNFPISWDPLIIILTLQNFTLEKKMLAKTGFRGGNLTHF